MFMLQCRLKSNGPVSVEESPSCQQHASVYHSLGSGSEGFEDYTHPECEQNNSLTSGNTMNFLLKYNAISGPALPLPCGIWSLGFLRVVAIFHFHSNRNLLLKQTQK